MQRTLKHARSSEEPTTLFDRFAVALCGGALTLVLGGIVLLLPWPIGLGFASKGAVYILFGASAVVAALGFALRINVVTEVVARLAHWVVNWW